MFYPSPMRSICLLLLAPCLIAAGQMPISQDPDALLRAGIAAQQRGNLSAAIEDFRKVLAIQPNNLEAQVSLGASLAANGQFDAAIEEDKRILAALPNHTDARRNLAHAYYKKGDLMQARIESQTLNAANPGNLPIAVLLA